MPWMPTRAELRAVARIPGLAGNAARLGRREFAPLRHAPKVQGRVGEWGRMFRRQFGGRWGDERVSYEANDWLMRAMRRECGRAAVTAVHAYEDCSLLQFQQAARSGRARIYDMPIGYYPDWEKTFDRLAAKYERWLLPPNAGSRSYVRPQQKRDEMALAELVLAPCTFVERTVQRHAEREVKIVPYGVDSEFWHPPEGARDDGPMRFLYAGQCSLRKGTPLLIEAWRRAAPKDATLDLVGHWQLPEHCPGGLPAGVAVRAPVSAEKLRRIYQAADVFVFPSNFEGFGLVILEAMACGLPVIATDTTAAPDILGDDSGRVIPADDLDALVLALRWAIGNRDRLAAMRSGARRTAQAMTWSRYRTRLREATGVLIGRGQVQCAALPT